MKSIIVVLSIVALFSIAYATDGWGKGKITRMRIQGGRILINQENMINPGNCPNSAHYHLDSSDSSFDRNRYATLRTAYVTGKEAWLALNGCAGGYPYISEVWVR